jgi:hypothetical protein
MFAISRRTIAITTAAALLPLLGAATADAVVVSPYGTRAVTVAHHPAGTPLLTQLRAGGHPGFDRLVLQFSGALPSYDIRYVPQLVQDGSGRPVELAGAANLRIRLDGAAAHRNSGAGSLVTPGHVKPLLPALREYQLIGDFEGVVTVGVGVTEALDFRVSELASPARLVVDIRRPLPRPTATAPRSAAPLSTSATHLTGISIGRHATYDRVVFRFDGRAPGYDVRYVKQVYADPSGNPVHLAGTAFLSVTFRPAAAHTDSGTATYAGSRDITRTGQVREVRLTGDFEAVLGAGIGVGHKAGFRVLRWDGHPSWVAIDVAR